MFENVRMLVKRQPIEFEPGMGRQAAIGQLGYTQSNLGRCAAMAKKVPEHQRSRQTPYPQERSGGIDQPGDLLRRKRTRIALATAPQALEQSRCARHTARTEQYRYRRQ